MLFNTPLDNQTFPNPQPGYPSLDLLEMLTVVRINKATGRELVHAKVIEAMDNINRQLGQASLSLPLDADQQRFYKRAVAYEAAALIGEDALDFDTSSEGQIRGENGLSKTQSLRQRVDHAVADILGKPRNRIRLI